MKNRNHHHNHSTSKNLSLLLLVFFIGLGSQAILNLSIANFIAVLDQKVKNAHIETLIGEEIILEIQKMETHFFEMASFPNPHLRRILKNEILEQQEEIEHSLEILNQGGVYKHRIDLNLPNTEAQFESLIYKPEKRNSFSFAHADIVPKFGIINQKLASLKGMQDYIDQLRMEKSPLLAEKLTELNLEVKLLKPLFHRIKEDANRIFYQNKLDSRSIQEQVEGQKDDYRNIQMGLTLVALFFGILVFVRLSQNIKNNLKEIEVNQDYTQDILDSQSNIIIVNDGVNIIDASGGFFSFFREFDSLESFSKSYQCICELFVKEEGYVYRFEDKNWIEYILQNPNATHKAKLRYQGKTTIFQVSAVKSTKYERYIISMFDISENERINQDLKIEKNKALAATQAKGEFLANMSHEIRTPLNAILGFISLMKDKTHDAENTKYLNTIDSSSHSLLGIINDILDFSKIESGKLDIDPSPFDPRKEFSSTADLFKARCSEKNLNFNITLSDALPNCIETDILRVKQVISNLLSNAIKFTEPNKAVSLSVDYQNGCLVCQVSDEGIGMTPEFQARIFEAFSQAESSTTRKYGGTGLGLTISAKLIGMLGGELKCESELHVGSRFSFSIPAKICQDLKPDDAPKIENSTQIEGHLLLVEDNKTNQLLMSALLKKQGLTFDIANDGLEAITALQERHYDLVLMDENMPNLNGIEATKQIRILEAKGELPYKQPLVIIAVTANAMTGDRERFLAAGMNEYLTKPINLPKLTEIFRRFLGV
ncbi:ATP-binding protein [Thiosulfativibrio zosterae]|uniref:histidine kinase n=1 Tax=Thiosulfativibrio zosterae TaxID=2675053 RepID=A0A6F8PK22_9GAMM|nr:ATP-binding protein [Thiosulfativibrio zosterae]BBP42350.1 hypothetical protein THMIRHAT_00960 [Thiosulfativibrio zosterae]